MLLVAGVAYESEQALAVQRGFVYIALYRAILPWSVVHLGTR